MQIKQRQPIQRSRANMQAPNIAASSNARQVPLRKKNTTLAVALPASFDNIPVFKSIVAVFVVSLCLYLYMVVSIVVATVDRKSLEEQVRSLTTELTYQETEYSARLSSITLASVRASGYIDTTNQSFATRANTGTLTLRNE